MMMGPGWSCSTVQEDGTRTVVHDDGTRVIEHPDGSRTLVDQEGVALMDKDGLITIRGYVAQDIPPFPRRRGVYSSIIANTNTKVFMRIEEMVGNAKKAEGTPPIGWQWKTTDQWHTVDKQTVEDPEEYARSMAGAHGVVRAIYENAKEPLSGTEVLFGLYDEVNRRFLTEVFEKPSEAESRQRTEGGRSVITARNLYAALPRNAVDLEHTISRERIRDVEKEFSADGGACGWRSCTGCHEQRWRGSGDWFSPLFNARTGFGCHECGGLGVVWEYWSADALDRMSRDLGEEAKPVDVAVEWQSLDTCPSSGSVWVCGGTSTEPELKEADGEFWRKRREKGLSHPTHWHPALVPAAPRAASN